MIKTFKFDDQGNIGEILFEDGLSLSVGSMFYMRSNYMLITKISSNRRGAITLNLVRKAYSGRDVYTYEYTLRDTSSIIYSNEYFEMYSPEKIILMKEEILEALLHSGGIHFG